MLKQNEFYCVTCRNYVTEKAADICVKMVKNSRIKGGVPALHSECHKCGQRLYKFIKRDDMAAAVRKFGRCGSSPRRSARRSPRRSRSRRRSR
jgi:hypothetical protein